MSTYILNPNDTIALSDSIVVKMTTAADACQMCVNEVATNWADVEVVKYICVAAVAITLIVSIAVLIYSLKKISAEQRQKSFDNCQKKKENDQRLAFDKDKHDIEIEEKKRAISQGKVEMEMQGKKQKLAFDKDKHDREMKEKDLKLTTESDKHEKFKNTGYAMDTLKEVSSMAKSKEGIADANTANELYKLYSEIKENES